MGKRMCSALLLLLLLLSLTAHAAEAETCTLTLSCRHDGTPLSGLSYSLYRVADMKDGAWTPVGSFASLPIAPVVGEEGRDTLANTLKAYVYADSIPPTLTGKTDDTGGASFADLPRGFYLLTADRISVGTLTYSMQPALITLPALDPAGDGLLTNVAVSPKFSASENPEDNPTDRTVTRKVLIVWEDAGVETRRPKSVIIELLRNGELFERVELIEENHWRWTWDGLDVNDEQGSPIEWTVVERIDADHTVEIEQKGVTFIVTNAQIVETAPPSTETDEPKLPQTGQIWLPVPYLLCFGLLFITVGVVLVRKEQK